MTLIPHTHEPAALPLSGPVFDAENIQLQRQMRFNPLRTLDPENLSLALDQFELGILRQAALLWEAIARRDDTLAFVKGQLENAIAGKPWGVFKKKGADPREAARHATALEYFYDNVTAVDAFDRNRRGGLSLLLRQMGSAASYSYAVHHFVWQPQPGCFLEVPGADPVPALRAELEHVPLWFFENVTGTLRFLPYGGFGVEGRPLDWDGEWMVTTGAGVMFAASICHVFKRLTFQDWTIFNERYAQAKVLGQTNARKDTEEGRAMRDLVENFNSDMGMVIYESQPGDKPPISLVGPQGSVSADLFERFLDRQDRKMTVLYRGSDLRNMSRPGDATGVSAQTAETDSLEVAHCHNIADACRTYIDRAVIKYCFGEGIEPLAYFGLPNHDTEDTAQVRANAGFLADRGALVELNTIAERLGITLTDNPVMALTAAGGAGAASAGHDSDSLTATANSVQSTENTSSSYRPSQARLPKGFGSGGKGTLHGGEFASEHGASAGASSKTKPSRKQLPNEEAGAKPEEHHESGSSPQPVAARKESEKSPRSDQGGSGSDGPGSGVKGGRSGRGERDRQEGADVRRERTAEDLREQKAAVEGSGRRSKSKTSLSERQDAHEDHAETEALIQFYPDGTFSITEFGWRGYPAGVPRPKGPFRLLTGAEYEAARTAANRENRRIRRQHGLKGRPLDIHEIHPVKFGGSPIEHTNKIRLSRALHRKQVTPWWNRLQKHIESEIKSHESKLRGVRGI